MTSESSRPDGGHVFFSLINAVLIVLSNVAFQQYALYKLEADRIEQAIDGLGSDYSESLMMENVIEIKNTLINTQLLMMSQRNMLDFFNKMLARDYNLSDAATVEEMQRLAESNRVLGDLMGEVANVSAYVSYTSPDLKGYSEELSKQIEVLEARKAEVSAKGQLVWNTGLLLILYVLIMTLYSLYLSQVEEAEEGVGYISKVKAASSLQVILGVVVVFGSYTGIVQSNLPVYLMNLLLFVTVALTALHTSSYLKNRLRR